MMTRFSGWVSYSRGGQNCEAADDGQVCYGIVKGSEKDIRCKSRWEDAIFCRRGKCS